jgi:hypothetical protein
LRIVLGSPPKTKKTASRGTLPEIAVLATIQSRTFARGRAFSTLAWPTGDGTVVRPPIATK